MIRISYPNKLFSVVWITLVIQAALFLNDRAFAQTISIETVAAPRITQTYRLRADTAAELQIHGFFQIPKINPAKFRITSFEIDVKAIAIGLSWTSSLEEPSYSAASRIFVSTSEDGNSLINRDEFYSNIVDKPGSYSTVSTANGTFTQEQIGLSQLYGNGTLPLFFWLIGGGRIYSETSGGAFGFVQIKTPVVRYTLEPLSSDTDPFLDLGEGDDSSALQLFSESQIGNRIPPSARAQLEGYLPEELFDLAASWSMNGRIFTGSFDTFQGYKYEVLVGQNRDSAELYQTIEGTGSNLTTIVDLSSRSEDRLFIWIRETSSQQINSP